MSDLGVATTPDPAIYSVDPKHTLQEINTIVAQREALLGPLITVGNDGNQTLLTFDCNPPEPERKARLVVGTAAPAGSAQVAAGNVFIAGMLTHVVAVRP